MDEVTIRTADLGDLNVLLSFEQALIQTERPFDATIRTGTDVRYYGIEAMISSPDVELVVAQLDSEVVGSGYARIETADAYLKHDKHSYLGFMYVVPEHRGKGINKEIIATLELWSRARGVTEMRLEVYDTNVAAINAYEKSGYRPLILTMRKDLAED